jgi:solute carrier family 32 (vesicular inhibitory amino acid transporter)
MHGRGSHLSAACHRNSDWHADHVRLLLNASDSMASVSDTALLVAAFAVVLPTTWLPNLAALSYIGVAGLFSAISMTAILVYYYATSPHAVTTDLIHIHSLPVTFGLLAFVFAGHAVFPAIYRGMKREERHKFPQVLDTSYVIVLVVCLTVGFCGYATFGSRTLEEITVRPRHLILQ